ncbi:hypothetical protein ACQX11_09735 [Corynebacterium diphtheriae]
MTKPVEYEPGNAARGISNGGACGLASEYTRDSKDIHEALHLVTADDPACPVGGVP